VTVIQWDSLAFLAACTDGGTGTASKRLVKTCWTSGSKRGRSTLRKSGDGLIQARSRKTTTCKHCVGFIRKGYDRGHVTVMRKHNSVCRRYGVCESGSFRRSIVALEAGRKDSTYRLHGIPVVYGDSRAIAHQRDARGVWKAVLQADFLPRVRHRPIISSLVLCLFSETTSAL